MDNSTAQMNAELIKLFARFDLNKDGHIDENEFSLLLKALGEEVDHLNFSQLFNKVDANGNGVVDFNEFRDWWLDFKA